MEDLTAWPHLHPKKSLFQPSETASFSKGCFFLTRIAREEGGERGGREAWLAWSSCLITTLTLQFLHWIREKAWTDEQFWC